MPFANGVVVTLNKKFGNFKKAVTSMRRGKKSKKDSRLQAQDYRQSLDAISEENLSIRKQIREKQTEIEKVKEENVTLKEEYEAKEVLFEEDRRFLCEEIKSLRNEISENQKEIEKAKLENLAVKAGYQARQMLLEEDKRLFGEEIKALKSDIKEKRSEIERVKEKNMLLKEEYEELLRRKRENKEALKQDKRKLEEEIVKLKRSLEKVHTDVAKNIKAKRNEKLISEEHNHLFLQEVESLRTVLELNQYKIKDMRMALAAAKQKEDALEAAVQKVRLWRTKCEDLREQLERKLESEQNLEREIATLRKVIFEENAQKKRLSYQNEELQWKLTRNKKTIKDVCEQGENNFQACPCSPKVQRVVKKRGSIGYVLNLDESPRKAAKSKVQTGRVEKPKPGKRRASKSGS